MSRHEAGWVPDTQPAEYQGQHRVTGREELEAAIWALLERHGAHVPNAQKYVTTLLSFADAYSSGDSETLTRLRRQVLHRERPDIGGERT